MLFFVTIVYSTLISFVNGLLCTSDGVFANPLDTHSFYRCTSGLPHLIQCPLGFIWNSNTEICDWKSIKRMLLK